MGTISVFEAVERATDPYGVDGNQTAGSRPSAKTILIRLGKLGFVVVPREMTRMSFTVVDDEREARLNRIAAVYPEAASEARLAGIEQYQAESR